ncbi:MAG: zf-HC2 domain-containing protein [Defluviitaleaceae bacterium]|nr:zf-HC2 domain-containing protein [Defluviitaleaceae bacterium]
MVSACEKYGELMMKYMDGRLDDFEQMNLDKHMEACEACREDFAMYQEMLASFDHSNEEIIEAPEGFAAAVMEKVEDINIYFPTKIRNDGKVLDSVIMAVWGFLVATFVMGSALLLYNEAIFEWLTANGLGVIVAALQPIVDFAFGISSAIGGYTSIASGWFGTNISDFAIIALIIFVGLVAVQFYMSPKYAQVAAQIKKRRRKIM